MALKLMCVVAHPDDECFAFGGALALAASRGVETSVICLTDGQAASHRGHAHSDAELGAMRRREFAASCGVLGVQRFEILEFSDGELESVDFAYASARLVQRMRHYRPDAVLTFGGDGALNTHADHMMVSMLTTAAFHWAGREKRSPELGPAFQPRRLFHLSTNFFLPDRPEPLPHPWTVTLDVRSVLDRKYEAFRQHTTQAPLMEQSRPLFEQYGAQEFYALVAATPPQPAQQMQDFFENLK